MGTYILLKMNQEVDSGRKQERTGIMQVKFLRDGK